MLGGARLERPDIYDLLVGGVRDSLKHKNQDSKDDQDYPDQRQCFHLCPRLLPLQLREPGYAASSDQARRTNPPTRETKNKTRKMKNKIRATPAAAAAIPRNPKTAAIKATTKNANAQRSIPPPVKSEVAPKKAARPFVCTLLGPKAPYMHQRNSGPRLL